MLKFLKWAVIVVVVLIVLLVVAFFGVAAMLPSDYSVERSIVIEAQPAVIHGLAGELTRWDDWMPWEEDDTTIKTTFGDQTTGVGAHQSWTGKDGSGEVTFTRCDEGGIAYDMYMKEMDARSKGMITYTPEGGQTKVVWEMEGSFDKLPLRYFGLAMDGMVGSMFDRGLNNLKKMAEDEQANMPSGGMEAPEGMDEMGDEAEKMMDEAGAAAAEAVGSQT